MKSKKSSTLGELIAENGRLKNANQQLARLVICMIKASGGEVRISESIIEDSSIAPWLSRTDEATRELILTVPIIKP